MTANLQPLREMAKKWRAKLSKSYWESAYALGRSDERETLADELDAWCDVAEAWLQDKHYYSREGIKKELVRAAFIGEKKP